MFGDCNFMRTFFLALGSMERKNLHRENFIYRFGLRKEGYQSKLPNAILQRVMHTIECPISVHLETITLWAHYRGCLGGDSPGIHRLRQSRKDRDRQKDQDRHRHSLSQGLNAAGRRHTGHHYPLAEGRKGAAACSPVFF